MAYIAIPKLKVWRVYHIIRFWTLLKILDPKMGELPHTDTPAEFHIVMTKPTALSENRTPNSKELLTISSMQLLWYMHKCKAPP